MRPELLVADLHGMLLRLISERAGCHFQGLSSASRFLKSTGRINNATAKKLARIDNAYNVVRHITACSVENFVAELTKGFDSSQDLPETSTTTT